MKTSIHTRSGFTLIELSIVLVIIGLAAGLAVPAALNQLESAKVKTAHNQIKALSSCLKSYYLDMGDYPDSLDALKDNPGGSKKGRQAGWFSALSKSD